MTAAIWADAMRESARAMWPYLDQDKIDAVARGWLAKQSGPLTLQQVAIGLEEAIAAVYGPPVRIYSR